MTNPHPLRSKMVWQPDSGLAHRTRLADFMRVQGIAGRAGSAYARLLSKAEADGPWFWKACQDYFDLRFFEPYTEVCESSFGMPWTVWCVGGQTNLVLNCLDRHRDTPIREKAALCWEGEGAERRTLSYADLDAEVTQVAAGLAARGITAGDVVALYMPAIPEAVVGMLATLKLGAVVLPLSLAFDTAALAARLQDSEAVAVLTADGARHGGRRVDLRSPLLEAVAQTTGIGHIVTVRNVGFERHSRSSRDRWWHRLRKRSVTEFATAPVPADAPALLLYTAPPGRRLRGTIQTHCGFMTKMALDFGLCLDWRADDRVLWMSDLGSLEGMMQIVATLLLGATLILAEGDAHGEEKSRLWRLMQDNEVSVLGTSPKSMRAAMQVGSGIEQFEFPMLRMIVSTGGNCTEEVWHWTFDRVCRRRIPILNYAATPELGGGVLCNTLLHPIKPGAYSVPIPGCGLDLVDEARRSVRGAGRGTLVLRTPSMGLTRGLWNDPGGYLECFWQHGHDLCWHGEEAVRDEAGFWYLQPAAESHVGATVADSKAAIVVHAPQPAANRRTSCRGIRPPSPLDDLACVDQSAALAAPHSGALS